MTLLGAYKDLYLSLVDWGRKVHGYQDLPEYNAVLGLASLATMNLYSLIMLGEVALGRRNLVPITKLTALSIWVGFVVLHYVTLLRAARLGPVDRSKSVPGTKMWAVCLYGLVSFVAYLALLSVRWVASSPKGW